MPIAGTSVARRHLGRRLRRLREAAKVTEQAVDAAKLASRAKLWRIESGKTSVRVGDVLALCRFYGVDELTTKTLEEMAKETGDRKGLVENNASKVPDWFNMYLALEADASEIRTYDPELIHGLLQTPEYIRALFREGQPDVGPDVVERLVNVRSGRQQAFLSRGARLTAILGAGVLTRPVGGRRVMAEQTRRLRELNQRPGVDIRVLPWTIGAHAAMHVGAFAILDFADPDDPPVVYLESHTDARYLEQPEELTPYRNVFALIQQKTVSIEEYRP